MKRRSPGNDLLYFPDSDRHEANPDFPRLSGSMPHSTSQQQQQKPNVDSMILSSVMAPPPMLTPSTSGPFQFPLNQAKPAPTGGFQFPLNPQPKPSRSQKKGKKGQAPKQPAQQIDPTAQSKSFIQSATQTSRQPAPTTQRPRTRQQVDAIKKMIFGNSLGMGLPQPGYRPRDVRRAYVS